MRNLVIIIIVLLASSCASPYSAYKNSSKNTKAHAYKSNQSTGNKAKCNNYSKR